MPTTTGRVSVYGLNGTLTYDGVATAHFNPESASFTDEHDESELTNGNGERLGVVWKNQRTVGEIEFIPVEDAIGTAIPADALKLPDIGSRVVLASMQTTALDGNYYYIGGGRMTPAKGDFYKITLPIRKDAGTDFSIAPS